MQPSPTHGLSTQLILSVIIILSAAVAAIIGLLPLVHVGSAIVLTVALYRCGVDTLAYFKKLTCLAVFLLGVFMALYRPEGFSYFNSISVERLHDGGKPFQQFVNLGKFFGALLIFVWMMFGRIKTDLLLAQKPANVTTALTSAIVVLAFAVVLLNLDMVVKFPEQTLTFLAINLIVTCFSEEVFYRVVVQTAGERLFSSPLPARISGVVLATAFFTLTHLNPQPEILAVMTVAGFCYALTYALTRSLTCAIITHFMVNALHFIFLPYPL